MFERYREDARRAIFFARWEAQQTGSAYIEPKHILLGLTHDADSKVNKLFGLSACTENLRILLGVHASAQPSTSVDLPLSNASKRVLAYAIEEADKLASAPMAQNICCWACCGKKNRAYRRLWDWRESICARPEGESGQHRAIRSLSSNRTPEKLH